PVKERTGVPQKLFAGSTLNIVAKADTKIKTKKATPIKDNFGGFILFFIKSHR
ncbi:MAG: hypothetical protein US56_C0005G0006, partial [Candidatus Moranbacteria bacterium GW2011_GWF2_37_7]